MTCASEIRVNACCSTGPSSVGCVMRLADCRCVWSACAIQRSCMSTINDGRVCAASMWMRRAAPMAAPAQDSTAVYKYMDTGDTAVLAYSCIGYIHIFIVADCVIHISLIRGAVAGATTATSQQAGRRGGPRRAAPHAKRQHRRHETYIGYSRSMHSPASYSVSQRPAHQMQRPPFRRATVQTSGRRPSISCGTPPPHPARW